MKNILIALIVILLACTSSKENIPGEVLSTTEFTNILREVHLAESAYEINISKGAKNAKINLANSYYNIYIKYNITDSIFRKSLKYYAKRPAILEEVYSDALNQLKKERSILDQK